jgi:hypothetical protein
MDMNDTTSWITFGKDHYHLNRVMEQWCHEHIGQGGWAHETPKAWGCMMGDKIWVMHSMFGNTTFCFKEEKDFMWFKLRWA